MQAFVRLVEAGTFTAAADELRVKQSTVSKWIAALEDELGVQLLERTTRSHHLTEAGQVFYSGAVDMLAAYKHTTAELASRTDELSGRLRVSVPVVFGRLFVVPVVTRFMKRHPKVEIELLFSDRYVNLVEDRIDVAIRVGVPVDSSFRAHKLGHAVRHLVASPGYVQSAPALTVAANLRDHTCLVHTALGAGDVWTLRKDGVTTRARVRGRFSANNSEALLAMARAGLGIALMADWLAGPDLRRGRLVALLPDYELPAAPTYALMPPNRYVHPRVRAFVDFVGEALEDGRSDS